MRIVDTITYDIESITVADYRKNHGNRCFMEHLKDVEHSPTAYNNDAYLASLRPNKLIYVVVDMEEKREVIR
jgi:hypothetical protein